MSNRKLGLNTLAEIANSLQGRAADTLRNTAAWNARREKAATREGRSKDAERHAKNRVTAQLGLLALATGAGA